MDHFHGKTFVPVFEEKSKERKNVNDGHMFAAEVFVHEILQQETHKTKKMAAAKKFTLFRDQACIS